MKSTATQVTALAVLAVLISVAAVQGSDSEAANAKQIMVHDSHSRLGVSPTTPAAEAPGSATTEALGLLPNGDFEQGPVVWTVFSLNGWDIIMDTGFPGPVTPHSGSWLAWLGGDDDEVSYIEQEIPVPGDALDLTYWHWIASVDDCGGDIAWVKVDGAIVEQYDLCSDEETNTWVLHAVDVSAYAGETVTLRLQVDTDSALNSNLFIDDVSIGGLPIFVDGFESGDTSAWSSSLP